MSFDELKPQSLPEQHQLQCRLCRQGIPCFSWLRMFTTVPTLLPDDHVAYAERGDIYRARVQACGAVFVALSVDLGGIFVQRFTTLDKEGVDWIRCDADGTNVSQEEVDAFKTAHALGRDRD